MRPGRDADDAEPRPAARATGPTRRRPASTASCGRRTSTTYSTLGNDVRGWARVLTAHLPAGKGYADYSFASRADAYDAIVDSLDATGRPVGIVVDRGSHAWTVVGFKVAEQVGVRSPGTRTILGFYVIGPLGAGRDPWPKAYYTVAQLSTRFTRYHESTRAVVWEGLYVIVEPLHPLGASVTSR